MPGISTTTIQRANTDLATFSFFEDLIARDSTGASTCIRHLPSNGGMYVTYIVDSKVGQSSEITRQPTTDLYSRVDHAAQRLM